MVGLEPDVLNCSQHYAMIAAGTLATLTALQQTAKQMVATFGMLVSYVGIPS